MTGESFLFMLVGAVIGPCAVQSVFAALRGEDRKAGAYVSVALVGLSLLILLVLAGCSTAPRSASDLDWRTDYRLVRIVFIGDYTDYATQHLCPADGKAVYTVFEDVVDHTRLWRCAPPRGKVGDVVSMYD